VALLHRVGVRINIAVYIAGRRGFSQRIEVAQGDGNLCQCAKWIAESVHRFVSLARTRQTTPS
jgi:hypothetical protein